jgi:hypothetical protein
MVHHLHEQICLRLVSVEKVKLQARGAVISSITLLENETPFTYLISYNIFDVGEIRVTASDSLSGAA